MGHKQQDETETISVFIRIKENNYTSSGWKKTDVIAAFGEKDLKL